VIPDVEEVIAEEVRRFSNDFDYVLTSGGVGPTHDDVTLSGVARAFGERLVRSEEMVDMLRELMKGREPNESQLKMCDLPESAELLSGPEVWFPLVRVANVYVFPGVPRLLQVKFESVRHQFRGTPIALRRLFLKCMESDVAQDLRDVLAEFSEVKVGSYPRLGEDEFRTLITLESRDETCLDRAVDWLLEKIPSDVLVRVE
jgi:FAD synthetase